MIKKKQKTPMTSCRLPALCALRRTAGLNSESEKGGKQMTTEKREPSDDAR
jgi:hypothetical protein